MKKENKYYKVIQHVPLPPFSENSMGEYEKRGEWEDPTYIYKDSIVKELPDPFGEVDSVRVQVLHAPTNEEMGYMTGETSETERRGAMINKKYLFQLTGERDLTACKLLDMMMNKSFENFKDMVLGEDEFEGVV